MSKKNQPAKSTKSPRAPRRSHSQFTSVQDAMLVADARPFRVSAHPTIEGAFIVIDQTTGKRAKGTPASIASRSSARRAMYKAEAATGFKVTARKLQSLRTAREKQLAK